MNIPQIKIIPATITDLKTILTLQKECYQTEAALHDDYDIPPLKQDLTSLEKEYKEGMLFLKAMIDGQIVGSVRGYVKNDTCFIGKLIVKQEFQNRKIGQTLMQAIESHFGDCQRYELFTGFKSEKNLYLYNKIEYMEFRRQWVNEKLTLVYLEKMKKD